MRPTPGDYLEAAQNGIDAARKLWETRYYVLAHYLAGQSVECLLMAYAQRRGAAFDARHDLRSWYVKAAFEEQIPVSEREEMRANLSLLAVQWNNDQRYYSFSLLRKHFHNAGLHRIRRYGADKASTLRGSPESVVKALTSDAISAAYGLVVLGVGQWQNSKRLNDKS